HHNEDPDHISHEGDTDHAGHEHHDHAGHEAHGGTPDTAMAITGITSDSSAGCFGSCWSWAFPWSRSIRCSRICWAINCLTLGGCGGSRPFWARSSTFGAVNHF